MARAGDRLTATRVKSLLDKGQVGRHPDGNRLYLVVTGKGRGWWMLRYMAETRSKSGKPLSREMGLGAADPDSVDGYTLAEARDRADQARRLLRDGIDPLAQRKADEAAKKREAEMRRTFREAAEACIAAKAPEWGNEKHAAQWTATLTTYAYPTLGDLPVSAIAMEQVKDVLAPIWTKKAETARRVRGRIEAVLDYATVHGWREGPNPARWKGNLALALAKKSKVAKVEHHAALPWKEVGAFLTTLQGQSGTAARALEFLILTAARTGEVIGARWSEIDLAGAVWTVPADRMKAGKEHRIPLSAQSLAVLAPFAAARAEGEGDGFVFPGQFAGKPLSNMAMLKVLERMKRTDLTVHGFRSTFRDWAGEATHHPREVIEHALAHLLKDKAEAAYARGDLFQKRIALMKDWAEFCSKAPATVSELRPVVVTA
ncbi:tyrosine-type recombinase/integrase [Neoroseomonas oryzicola]|uniref:Integrase arm-type DNA-binding domain-containing protein n=1 Tax=Neoroseomonas oryzicola TaxID=535904 RepID=A0A9X9WIR2_9PROT|nr:site-specific integrase [Neoroseomonas oryzicola]MBR0660222.1 integrase arm-type DNA-binding domain-containing protein [Neoroseomonas oryzicola]NKE16703.1 integrase arm-type DNA-binding domain-containing protein [Neoroseomonas oryzicola]